MTASRSRIFGLNVRSELPLLSCAAIPQDCEIDVDIRFESLARQSEWITRTGPAALQLDIDAVGRFLIRDGREIIVDATDGVSARDLRGFVLGSAFGALLHQRGLLPLHANAIVLDGKAVAFFGRSGAGKSTLAAWFHDRGNAVLADDVCAIRFDSAHPPLALPGVARLRLWKDALARTGRDSAQLERSFDGSDKFDVPTARDQPLHPTPLAACYLLADGVGNAPLRIERLAGAQAVEALVANTYRGAFVGMLGGTAAHLGLCVRLARTLPVHRVSRVMDMDRFDAIAAALLAHIGTLKEVENAP